MILQSIIDKSIWDIENIENLGLFSRISSIIKNNITIEIKSRDTDNFDIYFIYKNIRFNELLSSINKNIIYKFIYHRDFYSNNYASLHVRRYLLCLLAMTVDGKIIHNSIIHEEESLNSDSIYERIDIIMKTTLSNIDETRLKQYVSKEDTYHIV